MPHAFRCRNCGRLEAPEHAGENPIPAACRSCGKGVTIHFDGTVAHWVSDPDNWEILADLDKKALAKHGLVPSDVVAHDVTTWPDIKGRPGDGREHVDGYACGGAPAALLERETSDSIGAEDVSS